MTSRALKYGVAIAAAGAALALGTGSASAVGTYTVTAGNAPTATKVAITGTTQGASPQITFTDSTTGTVLNCASGTAPGSTTTGTALSGTAIGAINGAKTTWNTCTGPAGLTFNVTGSGTWKINALGGTATQVTGNITAIRAHVDGGALCTVDVKGSVPITYNNTSQVLTVLNTKSTLTVFNKVGSCFGAVNEGDKANFSAAYKLVAGRASFNPVKITRVS